ncbi:MAG: transposase [Enterobacteriaceae bacterium]|jgi:transposase|nr:transposase [Enterobacteriaceae bacterium]
MRRKSPRKFTDKFKKDAVNLVVEKGYTVAQAATAYNISTKLLYAWRKKQAEQP